MKKILSSSQMKEYENNTINNIGINAAILMERAGLKLKNYIISKFDKKSRILIVAGTGNNGADGLCLARLLLENGYKPDVLINYGHSQSDLFSTQLNILNKLDANFVEDFSDSYDLYVDALLGIGIRGLVDEKTLDLITKINQANSYVLSVDIPSGLDSTNGIPMPESVIANTTITFGAYKKGLFLNKGVDYTGEVILENIGIWDYDCSFDLLSLESEDLENMTHIRKSSSNKGTYGKVCVIAGSKDMCGCAILAAKAALKSGSGMVKLITHDNNRSCIISAMPELMIETYDSNIYEEAVNKAFDWADTIVCGPGIGTNDLSKELVSLSLKANKPLVLDADALNCISQDKNLSKLLYARKEISSNKTVITPHKAELSRILMAFDIITAEELSRKVGIVVVEKDAKTIIWGNEKYLNLSGNNGMSTAGSGDVLSGIIGSMMGFYVKGLLDCSFDRMIAQAVYIHGLCGDKAAENVGFSGLTASDIIENLSNVLV